jgi:sialidase-1
MQSCMMIAALALAGMGWSQPGGFVVKELDRPQTHGDPIIREDFERCEPQDAVARDERKPDTWVLRTKDWASPLLNPIGNPPDLTYDPQLTGLYDIYIGSRATDFEVSMGMRLSSEDKLTIITSPRGTKQVHYDWEFCFRREVKLDGEKIVIHALGAMAYIDYIKFVPIVGGKETRRVATDHVVIAQDKGKHFAFPGVARLRDGSLGVVFRQGTAHIDPSGSIGFCRSTDGGRTWAPRRTIYDDPNRDERDPGIWQHSGGTLVVSMASDGAQVMRSTDNGETWDKPTSAPVFSPHLSGELPDGRLFWCGIATRMGINHVEIAASEDLGKTWKPEATVAESLPYHQPWVREFWDEPHALPLPGGKWLCLHRVDRDGYLYQNSSGEGGRGFTIPKRTAMWGCPPFILRLQDGRLLALYGYRRPPFGIRGCLSSDDGATWDTDSEIVLRDDGGHVDLGYPTALELQPGLVLVVYYFNHGGPECTIEGTFLKL